MKWHRLVKSKMTVISALMVVVQSSLASQVNPGCVPALESMSPETNLSHEQLNAIQEAKKGEYLFFAQKKMINGKERVIVLMGEGHIKSSIDSQRGKDVLAQFSYRGQEGFDPENYWFSGQLKKSLTHKTTKKRSAGSSIDDAILDPLVKQSEELLVQRTAEQIANNELTMDQALEKMTVEHLLKSTESLDGQQKALIQLLIPRMDTAKMAEQIKNTVDTIKNNGSQISGPQQTQAVTNYSLEKGYKPTLREKLAGLGYIVGNKVLNTKVCAVATCVLTAGAMVIPPHYQVPLFIGEAAFMGTMIGTVIMTFFGREILAAVDSRNTQMANTLNNVLEQDPNVDKIVVIVGMNHVPGIADLLANQGFIPVDLDHH